MIWLCSISSPLINGAGLSTYPIQVPELGFDKYIRRDGLRFPLVPVENSRVNDDWMMDKVMNKFGFGNANVKRCFIMMKRTAGT